MTPDNLRSAREALGLPVQDMAASLFLDVRSYQRMEAGAKFIPELVARVVALGLKDPDLFSKLAEIRFEDDEMIEF